MHPHRDLPLSAAAALLFVAFFPVVARRAAAEPEPDHPPQSEVFITMADRLSGPTVGHQRNPAISNFGSGAAKIVVWDDKREDNEDIYARIIHGVSGASSFPVATPAGDQKRPAVCRTDTGALIIWEDRRNTSDPRGPRDLYAATVDARGAVSPALGTPIAVGAGDESDVELVRLDSGAIAVWELDDDPALVEGIYAVRFSVSGELLDGTPALIQEGTGKEPSLAAAGDRALMVWENSARGVSARVLRWTGSGIEIGEEIVVGSPGDERGGEPVAAWDGESFLVVWGPEPENRFDRKILMRRLGAGGELLDPSQIVVARDIDPRDLSLYSPYADSFVLISGELFQTPRRQVLTRRQIQFGTILDIGDPEVIDTGPASLPEDPDVIGGGGLEFIVWEDEVFESAPGYGEEVMGKRRRGDSSDPFVVSISTTDRGSFDGGVALANGDGGTDSLAFVASGGDVARGLFLVEGARTGQASPRALGPILGEPLFDLRNLCWLAQTGQGNARIVVDVGFSVSTFLDGPFADKTLSTIALAGQWAIGTEPVYSGGAGVYLEKLPRPFDRGFISDPMWAGSFPEAPDQLLAVEAGGALFLAASRNVQDRTETLYFAKVEFDSVTGRPRLSGVVEPGLPDFFTVPFLVRRGGGAELIWRDPAGDSWAFSRWDAAAPAPAPTVFSSDLPRHALFTHGVGATPPVALWGESVHVADGEGGRDISHLIWQTVGSAGTRSGIPNLMPIPWDTDARTTPLAIAQQQGLFSAPRYLAYLRSVPSGDLMRTELQMAFLTPLSPGPVVRSHSGSYSVRWAGTHGADLLIESSTDLLTWTPSLCSQINLFGTSAALPIGNFPPYWRARYVLP